jgi:hypothetical protein
MNMPGFTAEAVLGRPARTYSNYGSTRRSPGLEARAEPALVSPRLWDSQFLCYRECADECIRYGLDTPAHCANDCYLGCLIAT